MSDKTSLSVEQAKQIIADIAKNGDGASQLRAALAIVSQEQGTSALPDPLTDPEILDRLARLIRAVGPTGSQIAYRKAFPAAKSRINGAPPKVTFDDMPPVDKASLPRNLRELYRFCPEIKKPGIPVGFPVHKGIAVQKEWCQAQALKILRDREQSKVDLISVIAEAETPNESD